MSFLLHLECSACREQVSAHELHNLCPACGKPLFARYDLARVAKTVTREAIEGRAPTLWRYRELLPVIDDEHIISLGEGGTPLIHAERLGTRLGLTQLYVKDESVNPTGSFKARGLAVAVSKAQELGARTLAIPSAGNAAGAMAAYAAKAGLDAYVVMPRDTPTAFIVECRAYGAHVELVDGLITDAGRLVAERREREGWFDVSTLKEPYRVEGKKTMGYELAEQLGWSLPDVLIYPAGGGTGLIGMWKAFDELEALGWIGPDRPRMIAVQAAGCAPIVRAFEQGLDTAPEWKDAFTLASGLRVPRAIGDFLMLRAIRDSGGCAIAVTDEAMIAALRELAATEGIFPAPEGGATLAGLHALCTRGLVNPDERVVLFNTGSGLKYVESLKGWV